VPSPAEEKGHEMFNYKAEYFANKSINA